MKRQGITMRGKVGRGTEFVLGAILALSPLATAGGESPPQPERDRLREHVAILASPEFAGRRGEGARKAEAYVTEQFRRLGLEPGFNGSFTQDIPGKEPNTVIGRNVAAMLAGSDPAAKDQWVLVAAHYDHLGVRNGKLYPGADDDASGMAMLFEVARCLPEGETRPRRSVLFVAFDLEENGLWGSRRFVQEPPVPLDRIALMLDADIIGGALADVCARQVFVMGSEHAPALRPWIDCAARGQPLEVATVGSDLLMIDRSDYGPFRMRKVPYLFFSTGQSSRYHSPNDTPESLDYPKLEAISRVIAHIAATAVMADKVPKWQAETNHPPGEVASLRKVVEALYAHRADLKLNDRQLAILNATRTQLESVANRGTYSAEDRAKVLHLCQLVLYTVL